MNSQIDADELIASSILDCNQTDASPDRLSAALMTRVLGHRGFSGSGLLRVTERAAWSFEGGFGEGISYGTHIHGSSSNDLTLHMNSLREGYAALPYDPSEFRDGVVLPQSTIHLFGIYEPSLAVCYLITPDNDVTFTPEAVKLVRHSVEQCLRRPGVFNVTADDPLKVKIDAEVYKEFFSGRQIKVLHLLAEGQSNADIGRNLSISASLAKQEVAFIMHSLQARNRLDAVLKAQRRGIIPSAGAPLSA